MDVPPIVYVGQKTSSGTVLSIEDAKNKPLPIALVYPMYTECKQSEIKSKKVFDVLSVTRGLIGRTEYAHLYNPTIKSKTLNILIVGPVGSGRRSLAAALLFPNYILEKVNAADCKDKFYGETQSKLKSLVSSIYSKSAIHIPLIYGLSLPSTDTADCSNATASDLIATVSSLPKVVVISTQFIDTLSHFTLITMKPGSRDAIEQWIGLYHPTVDLYGLAESLEGLDIYPNIVASADPKNLISSIKLKLIPDNLRPNSTITYSQFYEYLTSKYLELRPSIRDSIVDAYNTGNAGCLLYGPPGTGKTYSYHTLHNGNIRYADTLKTLDDAWILWKVFKHDAPMYIILLDECDGLFKIPMHREFFLSHTGNVDSPKNIFIIATTNSTIGPGGIDSAIWRDGRLKPILTTWATKEEFTSVVKGIPFIEQIPFSVLFKLQSSTNSETTMNILCKTLTLIPPTRYGPLTKAVPYTVDFNGIELISGNVYNINHTSLGALRSKFDIVYEGESLMSNIDVYGLLGTIAPKVLVILTHSPTRIPSASAIIAIVHIAIQNIADS